MVTGTFSHHGKYVDLGSVDPNHEAQKVMTYLVDLY
jgi:hypothetical protein